ncbi:hypothetical protein [Methylibium petroleiphilum]|uniref:Lipoprotein n=1 Tax=Methylibium petroleiphilum (strain ATCC BAA-1232 / LMG 22953 / PM1) TaxID=420662 RepID=A2SND5_METPP|nr:hypothetical protein [Methylibium petroleiphilum]ABM97074.1 hypothetical protein Mpe_B0299 [Methylibium petroleiphilum PM1]
MSCRPFLPRALRAFAFAAALLSHGCSSPPTLGAIETPERQAWQPQGLQVTTEIDERPTPAQPILLMAGISQDNVIQPEEMRIQLVGAPKLDASASIGVVFDDKTRTSIQLAGYWRHDASDNTLVIPADAVRELLGRLPNTPVQVMLGLAGSDGDFAYAVRFELRAPPPPVVAEAAKGTPA